MAYRGFKDLRIRTASDEVLWNKAFNIATNLKYRRYQRGIASMIYNIFDKKSLTQTGTTINSNSDSENQQLAEKLDESKLIF